MRGGWIGSLFAVAVSMALVAVKAPAAGPDPARGPARMPEAYEHAGGTHKLLLLADDRPALDRLTRLGVVERRIDYGSLTLLTVGDRAIPALREPSLRGATLRDDFDLVAVNRWLIDTRRGEPKDLPWDRLDVPGRYERQLYLVQLVGPPKDEWLADLRGPSDADIVTYLPNNAYAVFASPGAWQRISRQAGHPRSSVQWAAALHPAYRISPALEAAIARNDRAVDVVVQFVEHPDVGRGIADLKAQALALLMEDVVLDGMRDVRVRVPAALIPRLAARPDVLWIEPCPPKELQDEVQGQIVAGHLDATGTQPAGPGYLSWLNEKGFTSTFPFVIDVADDGIDRGSTTDVHEDFLDASGASRIAYILNYTDDPTGDSGGGHGNINASIAGGYNDTQGNAAYEDAGGYQYGLGIAPHVLLGGSKIFPNIGPFTSTPYTTLISNAYKAGARISSNSWRIRGIFESPNIFYTSDARAYDALVRDAVPGQAGNQEMSILFAAGNSGSTLYTVSSPGTGKNVLTVGASESTRTDESETCLFFPGGADNATDIASFSSRGPTYDGRRKPDLVAPGTNIQGAASRSENFSGQRVCGTYYPPGQTLYAWSSGTSHSTPAVAGAAALTRQWFAHQGWGTPSPAMTKAFLMATPAYINGAGAGGDLPSNAQGYGLLDLGRALDGTPNLRVDQTHVFGATGETYTLSGRIWTNAQPFRVMLAWTDAPGPLLGLPWVNNLDLEVAVDGTLYRGNVFSFDHSIPGGDADFRNNTEAVFLPAGTAGEFSITVRAKGVYGNGVPGNGDFTDQDFALFVYNGTEGGPPPELTVSVSPDSRIVPQGGSESFAVALTSLNGFAGEAVLSLSGLPGGAAGVFSPGTVSVHPGGPEVSTLTVTADATTPPGAYPLTIAATSGTLTRFANAVLNVQLAESPDQVLTYGVLVRGLIRDNSSAPLTSTIAVPDEMTIKSVGVDVHIQHEKRGDLEVWLAGPDGRTVLLHDRTGGWMNDLDTTYDIATRSVQSLAAFDGLNTLGPWTLFARDLVFGDSGILVDWTLVFNGYYTASPTLAIPDDDASGIVSTIDVQAAGTVSNLIVRADITHTFKGDLEVSLTGPDGTTVLLHNRTGWFLDDIDTVYPDQTAPVESLDVFKGKATQGAWSLKVRDLSSFGVGRLNSWEIDFGAPTIPPF